MMNLDARKGEYMVVLGTNGKGAVHGEEKQQVFLLSITVVAEFHW